MLVKLKERVIETLKRYPKPIRENIFNHISMLGDPYAAPNVERLLAVGNIYRMHIDEKYTVIFKIIEKSEDVHVLDLMTIEQAQIRFGRYY
jgi:mRNA-degrading endonuclease RelE of RelBE toxin-antitoxin system